MKKILFSTLLLSLFCLPVFAQNFIFVMNKRNSTIYIKPNSIRHNEFNRNVISFKTHILYRKGYEKDFNDFKNSKFEEWEVTANCDHYTFGIEKIDFYNKQNQKIESVNTMNLPFDGYSGRAKPHSEMSKVLNKACHVKLL